MIQKHTSTKALLLAFVLVLALIIPVSAGIVVTGNYAQSAGSGYPIIATNVYNFSYNATPDKAISVVEYDLPIGSTTNFTVTYGTGSTVSGSMIYVPAALYGLSWSNITLDDQSRSETFPDAQLLGYALTRHIHFSSYGINTSADPIVGGFTLYSQGYGVISEEILFCPVENLQSNLITSIIIESDMALNIVVEVAFKDVLATTVYQNIQEYIAQKAGDIGGMLSEWLQIAMSYAGSIKDFVFSIGWILKFFFIDNLLLIIALWISVSMAYAAVTSRNIWAFYTKFFRTQRALLDFVVSLWDILVRTINSLVQIFVKWL